MPDLEHKGLLDREIFSDEIQKSFKDQLHTLEQIINYGTNLIPRCFSSSNKGIPEIVVILSFLKHAVSSLDGIHILVKEGSALSCVPLLRSLFEINLYLEWIFESDTKSRATAYFVWEQRRKIFWYKCYIIGTPEFEAHENHMKDSLIMGISLGQSQEELKSEVSLLESKLAHPDLRDVNGKFDDFISNSRRGGRKSPEWYQPFGPDTIRGMAKSLKKEGEYKVIYSQFSQNSHGLSFYRQISFGGSEGKIGFEPIRSLDSIDEIFTWSFNFSIEIFRRIIKEYRSGEIDAFNRKYLEEWRASVTSVPVVKKTGNGFTVTPCAPREMPSPGC